MTLADDWLYLQNKESNMKIFLALSCALFLSGCGDDFATYNKPANPDQETDWHRCMRQSSPIGRSSKCEDLR